MIQTLYFFFFWPVFFQLVLIFSAWIYYSNRKIWPARPAAKGSIFRCKSCRTVYVEERELPLLRCAHCGTVNEVVRR